MGSTVRLFVDQALGEGQTIPLERDQAHYLFAVMRRQVGDRIELLNGRDGSWQAEVVKSGKRGGLLSCQTLQAPLAIPPDLWLIAAPIRRARMDYVLEKAVELGVRRIVPVQTAFTNERFRPDKARSHIIEAAEQCGANYVPQLAALQPLKDVLQDWPGARSLMFCDEAQAGTGSDRTPLAPAPAAVLIGPEGGFSPQERDMISPLATTLRLGPRILRADTAAVAALSIWQATKGDWHG